MKVLYVSTMPLDYSSSANMRNIALLKGLQLQGVELYLLTHESQKDLQHYDETLCNGITFKKKYIIKLSNIHAKATMKKNKKNKLKNILYNFLIKFKIYDFKSSLVNRINEINITEKFDAIISSSDPKSSHLLAKTLINKNPGITKKWIQYWGDPFAIDVNNKKLIPRFLIRKEEEKLISGADAIVYVSPLTLEKQKEIYKEYSNKMYFLPIPYKEELISKNLISSEVTLGYFGDFYSRNRNILPLYQALEKCTDVKLIICGNSDIKLDSTSNIKVNTRMNLKDMRKIESEVNALVCVCNKSGTQIPGKIYHYSATNKPIIVILDGENTTQIRKYLEKYDRYIICENNIESIIKLINYDTLTKRKFLPCKELEASYIAKKLLEIINVE